MTKLVGNLERIKQSLVRGKPTESEERLAAARLRAARGRPVRKPRANLGQVAGKLQRKMVPKRLPMILRIKGYWSEIMGPQYAQICEPIKLTGGALDKVLHIRVPSSLALIIQHDEDAIRQRLNNMAGGRVHKLRLHQGVVKPPQRDITKSRPNLRHKSELSAEDKSTLAERSAVISDPKLRAAIEKLGQTMLSRE